MADRGLRQSERVRKLLATRPSEIAPITVSRPGTSRSSPVRFAATSDPGTWSTIEAGRPLVDELLGAIEDGGDRIALGWPERPGSAFTLLALSLRDARSSGRLASATIALWPWRRGVTRASRSILVHPADVAESAKNSINDGESKLPWRNDGLAHQELDMIELRLRDLVAQNAPPRTRGRSAGLDVVVRSPTLLETTVVFGAAGSSEHDFAPAPEQILRRVRDHTHLGDHNAGLERSFDALGDPRQTPFGVFALPPLSKRDDLRRLLTTSRFATRGLDAIVLDLTRNGRSEIPDTWEARLGNLLAVLTEVRGRRPPLFALCDDAFTMKRVANTLKAANSQLKPRRRAPSETGALLSTPGLLGPRSNLSANLPPVSFQADIKDASLAAVRKDLVALGRRMRDAGDARGAGAVSEALSFLRRVASLPVGLDEARRIADILYDGGDEVDQKVRAMFRPMMALAPLAAIGESHGSYAAEASRLVEVVGVKIAAWSEETPVSFKLAHLLEDQRWNEVGTLVALPGRRIADILTGSDRAVEWRCAIVDHRSLGTQELADRYTKAIIVGPTPEAIRKLLVDPKAPSEVLLLGDAAGVTLLAGELAPLERIPAFAAIAARARAIGNALKRGGAEERIDQAEAEFRMTAVAPEREIDLTREGGEYRGDIVRISTARDRHLSYRPNSDVLVFSAGEARPFERVPARLVKVSDDILVLNEAVREPIRRALAKSRQSLGQLALYHEAIARIRRTTEGATAAAKSRSILAAMRQIDPAIPEGELLNIQRWLTADLAPESGYGTRQPRAARDWRRFRLFMQAVGVDEVTADLYFRGAILPTRSYRSQEGHAFNQRVVQFILDPEGTAVASREAWRSLQGLWQLVLDAVDEVISTERIKEADRNG